MMPPPITATELGSSACSKISSLVHTRSRTASSSGGMNAEEPVAITTERASTRV